MAGRAGEASTEQCSGMGALSESVACSLRLEAASMYYRRRRQLKCRGESMQLVYHRLELLSQLCWLGSF